MLLCFIILYLRYYYDTLHCNVTILKSIKMLLTALINFYFLLKELIKKPLYLFPFLFFYAITN